MSELDYGTIVFRNGIKCLISHRIPNNIESNNSVRLTAYAGDEEFGVGFYKSMIYICCRGVVKQVFPHCDGLWDKKRFRPTIIKTPYGEIEIKSYTGYQYRYFVKFNHKNNRWVAITGYGVSDAGIWTRIKGRNDRREHRKLRELMDRSDFHKFTQWKRALGGLQPLKYEFIEIAMRENDFVVKKFVSDHESR